MRDIKIGKVSWTVQILLAVVFLFAGSTKLLLPAAALEQQGPFPAVFLRFIGLAELAGALGLVLPGLLGIHRELTSLAAAGLVIIMIGATISTIAVGAIAGAVVPFAVGLLAYYIARKYWSLVVKTSAGVGVSPSSSVAGAGH
jgi:uncharacterized membrane protein YphA (DoxX/SURF4 family)